MTQEGKRETKHGGRLGGLVLWTPPQCAQGEERGRKRAEEKQKTDGGCGASLCGHHPLCLGSGQRMQEAKEKRREVMRPHFVDTTPHVQWNGSDRMPN